MVICHPLTRAPRVCQNAAIYGQTSILGQGPANAICRNAAQTRREALPAELKRFRRKTEFRTKEKKRMKMLKVATTVGCMALMGAVLTPSAVADAWNRKTVITFSGPVEIPGVHL